MADLRHRLQAALGERYDVERELGRGGMAVVFAARDGELRRNVAIKLLPPELGATDDLRARFTREARTAAGLSHPNIAPIYDVGEGDGLAWIVMALVDGESVSARVERDGPLSLALARRVVSDVAQALAYAHARGVVHRDIKPDNILIDRESGRALVMDFGIAKARSDATDLTAPGTIVGTARYMSPEQALGEPGIDARADIYALGLVAYYMLAGGHAITGTTLPAIISAHVRGVAVDFTALGRRLPAKLNAALQKCVASDPALRYARMEDLLEQLRELGGDQPELSPAIRILLKELRNVASFAALSAAAIWMLGAGKMDVSLLLLAVGFPGWLLVDALENADRSGITWSQIRRALYVSRAHLVEERRGRSVGPWSALVFVLVASAAAMFGATVARDPSDVWIVRMGAFGQVVITASLLGVLFRHSGVRLPFNDKPQALFLLLVALSWLIGILALSRVGGVGSDTMTFILGVLPMVVVTAAGMGVLMGRLLIRMSTMLSGREAAEGEWRVPRWLDIAGSWLFARITGRDGRLVLERERAAHIPGAGGVAQVRKLARAIAGERSAFDGSLNAIAAEAAFIANRMVEENTKVESRMDALAARVARLSEGVRVADHRAAGATADSELEEAERELNGLKRDVERDAKVLAELADGLRILRRTQDDTGLRSALARAHALSREPA